jgi:hypothetical protein
MARFPIPGVAWARGRLFRPKGLEPGQPFAALSPPTQRMPLAREQITVLADFVEVALAREGHDGPVGIICSPRSSCRTSRCSTARCSRGWITS